FEDNCEFADESLLFSKYIRPTFTVPGDPYNVKITKSEDYEAIIFKTAIGYDLHKLEDSDDKNSVIFFGGVAVPSKKRVVAHSDGDSVIHALIDALFSAIGDTDIGVHFPDNNPQYKGISSVILLQEVAKIYETIGRRVKNISIIIVIDAPKLQNIVPEIKESLADTLNISPSDIGISCKTTEGTSPDTYIAYASVTVL
ncbi:MAG: 2-C-methyl-D-erythritol 2,4-cyclodiphosphate synthase, partial [Christensenellaceae bacterium]|nr:2-C-methyl-D-erythritol 2,4-cyclodiphosphate synthase [Christensenellaceae bacterium]